jgi:hypothetical protein
MNSADKIYTTEFDNYYNKSKFDWGDFFFFLIFFGGIFFFFFVLYSALLHLPPSDSTVPTDAGIEPRTVATGALAVRRSKHLARYHPWGKKLTLA